MIASGKEKKEGIVKENRINMYALLYFKWIIKKVLLYSAGNCIQCCVAAWMGGKSGGHGYAYMYG